MCDSDPTLSTAMKNNFLLKSFFLQIRTVADGNVYWGLWGVDDDIRDNFYLLNPSRKSKSLKKIT